MGGWGGTIAVAGEQDAAGDFVGVDGGLDGGFEVCHCEVARDVSVCVVKRPQSLFATLYLRHNFRYDTSSESGRKDICRSQSSHREPEADIVMDPSLLMPRSTLVRGGHLQFARCG